MSEELRKEVETLLQTKDKEFKCERINMELVCYKKIRTEDQPVSPITMTVLTVGLIFVFRKEIIKIWRTIWNRVH